MLLWIKVRLVTNVRIDECIVVVEPRSREESTNMKWRKKLSSERCIYIGVTECQGTEEGGCEWEDAGVV